MPIQNRRRVRQFAAMLAVLLIAAGCSSAPFGGRGPRWHLDCPDVYYYSPVWSPDGMQIAYVMHSVLVDYVNQTDIHLLTATGDATIYAPGSGGIYSLSWSPSSKILLVDWGDVRVINPDGSNPVSIPLDLSFRVSNATWSPDGYQIALTQYTHSVVDTMYLTDVTGSKPVNIGGGNTPKWSPDGSRLVFTHYAGTYPSSLTKQVFVTDSETWDHIQLTDGPSPATSPVWSPDGTHIAYLSATTSLTSEIVIMQSDGSQQTQLTTIGVDLSGGLAWSPKGDSILFVSSATGNSEIYAIQPDGSGLTQLTTVGGIVGGPEWSPQGDRILFISNATGLREIYTIQSDGSGLTQLTQNPSNGVCPH